MEYSGEEVVFVRWFGIEENDVPSALREDVIDKIFIYSRRPNVRAIVHQTVRIGSTDPDEELNFIVICNGSHYFVLVTATYTLVLWLHDVRNDIIMRMPRSAVYRI